MTERILAVDPGKISGYVYADVGDDLVVDLRAGQRPWFDLMLAIEDGLDRVDTIVCEDFLITSETAKKTRGQLWSLEQRGILRYFAEREGKRFVTQRPTDAKRFMTDEKLRSAGWYHGTTGGHENDAKRHLGLYLTNTGRVLQIPGIVEAGRS